VRRRAALAAFPLVLLVACSSGGPSATPTTPAPVTTTSKAPKPRKKPSATPTATPSPTPTVPPPPTGAPVGTAGSLLALAEGERTGGECADTFPDMGSVECGSLQLDAGTLLWGVGRIDGAKAVRLLTPVEGGYAPRYEGRDRLRTWSRVRVTTAALTGRGTDGVLLQVRTTDGALTYDVLTWFAGGPLVLRAHRTPRAGGRLTPVDGGLLEYTQDSAGYVRRRLAWDGRHFLLSPATRVTS
jgi:hypothetical protein